MPSETGDDRRLAGCASPTARSRRSRASTSRSHEGEAFGFLGPNGAGKSSTMRMIAAVSPVTAGDAVDPRAWTPRPRARRSGRRIGVCPQEDSLDNELRVKENLVVYGRYFGLSRKEASARADELLSFVQLSEKAERPGRAAVRWHEAPADHRAVADQPARPAAARRADDRARPAGPAPALGPAVPAQAAGRDAGADHALHGRGRAAVRPARGDGQGADRRRRLAARS